MLHISFSTQEPKLRALQYLPDIIKLQKMMLDKYDRKMSQHEALTIRVGSFLDSVEDCKFVSCYVTVLYLYGRCAQMKKDGHLRI